MIGDIHAKIRDASNTKQSILKIYNKVFGVLDIHTHIRFEAIKPFIKKDFQNYGDIGAGGGYMAIEIMKKVSGNVIGIVYDDNDLITANKIAIASKGNIKFEKGSILNLSTVNQKFDQIFCIDVLEHIEDDHKAIQNLKYILKSTGLIVLSVPTRLYPRYFGDKFAKDVGHVREGYSLDQISTLLDNNGLELIDYQYHTKKFGHVIAKIWYQSKFFNRHHIYKFLLHPFLLILAYLDKYTSTKNPLGLVIIAKIREGGA